MPYFPKSLMPKRLARETSDEVDGWPLGYNARDYNIHHREIRSIENLLVGEGISLDSTNVVGNIEDAVNYANKLMSQISDGSLMLQSSGVIRSGESVPLPTGITYTTVTGPLATGDTTITVPSTANFPKKGFITKFNSLKLEERCSDGSAPAPDCSLGVVKYYDYADFITAISAHRTNQEFIYYYDKTDTTFEHCVRASGGTTSQTLDAADTSILICGKASVMFSPIFWATQESASDITEFCIGHDANLLVTAYLLGQGSSRRLGVMDSTIGIAWSMDIIGWFDDISMAQLYSSE